MVRGLRGGHLLALAGAVATLVLAAPAGSQATPSYAAARSAGPDLPARSDPGLAQEIGRKPIGAGRLERRLGDLASRAPGASGFYVFDLGAESNPVLFGRDENDRRKLASNTKLFTTATALGVLGPEDRLDTRVKVDGEILPNGQLKGDLYLIGAGDPSFGPAGVDDLARDVRRAGIEKVSGVVHGDDSIFDRRRGVPDSNFDPSEFIAPLSGLTYAGSTYAEDPALAAARAFKDELAGDGIAIDGKVKVAELPGKLRSVPEIGSYESDKITALAEATNVPSDNFYAEMLLKVVAAAKGGLGTTRNGTRVVERFARAIGSRVDVKDGSGLTDGNRSSPRDVVRLLTGVRSDESIGGPFFDSLAIAGKEGTLDDRMEGTPAAGKCRAKTGTISGVSALSGYCRSGGDLVAFSILMNGVGDFDAARAIQDEMVAQIAKYRR